jgi:predicted nucleic acid-binding protein
MSRVYWDTMLFVYWLEDQPQHADRVHQIWTAMEARGDTLCSSVFTVGEVMVGPYKRGRLDVASEMREFLQAPHVELIPFTIDTADRYARIRADHRVSAPDAIHLASAAQAGVELFLTNDHRLQRVVIPGIDFIAAMDVILF